MARRRSAVVCVAEGLCGKREEEGGPERQGEPEGGSNPGTWVTLVSGHMGDTCG